MLLVALLLCVLVFYVGDVAVSGNAVVGVFVAWCCCLTVVPLALSSKFILYLFVCVCCCCVCCCWC